MEFNFILRISFLCKIYMQINSEEFSFHACTVPPDWFNWSGVRCRYEYILKDPHMNLWCSQSWKTEITGGKELSFLFPPRRMRSSWLPALCLYSQPRLPSPLLWVCVTRPQSRCFRCACESTHVSLIGSHLYFPMAKRWCASHRDEPGTDLRLIRCLTGEAAGCRDDDASERCSQWSVVMTVSEGVLESQPRTRTTTGGDIDGDGVCCRWGGQLAWRQSQVTAS